MQDHGWPAELAGLHGVEAVLAERLDALFDAGELPDLKQLRDEFAPRQTLCPKVVIHMPPVAVYDTLLDKVTAWNEPSNDNGRMALMLNELRLPTIGRLWPEFAERLDREGWQATRLIGALLEHELAERVKRRIERHRAESHLDPTKTLATFDFSMVPMVSKAHVTALATGESWLEKGATALLFVPARDRQKPRHL